MKQKKMILTSKDVKIMFETNLINIQHIAINSKNADDFKKQLLEGLDLKGDVPLSPEKENLKRLIMHDGMTIKEASTEREMKLETITYLWNFLTNKGNIEDFSPDFLFDTYKQFEGLTSSQSILPDKSQMIKWMKRWDTGTDSKIIEIRKENKQRIINRLIERIEKHNYEKSRYAFPPGISFIEKQEMIKEWWFDYRFHLSMAARSWRELNQLMGNTLSDDMKAIYQTAQKKGIPVFVTPYYLSLMDVTEKNYDDAALRSYVFYSQNLVDTFGNIKAWEKEDQVETDKPNAAGWLLPEGHNIHRRYPEVAILIPDTIGRACGGLCASCQRLYDFQSGRFNFDMEALIPKQAWDSKLKLLMKYFLEDKQLRDILITGGDALMSRNNSLKKILDAVYVMAKQKQHDNMKRPSGEKYAEIQRVRLGTRLPVYLPMRINDELITILSEFKEKAVKIGITQFFIQTHFQTPLEITLEVRDGIRKLNAAGWTVTNQLVYNVAASRRGHSAKLRRELNKIGVLCYYTFSVKGFDENHAVFTPNSRSLQEQQEEKMFGQLNAAGASELIEYLNNNCSQEKSISQIEKKYDLPFLATDRNVMNLPGIGKSMTFNLVAIMPDGCRILAFTHDNTRRHSPVIKDIPIVYIKENKSLAEYIRQLSDMGEKVSDYSSLWKYTSGKTEPRFAFYEYPKPAEEYTTEYSNIAQ
ncbi:MAG: KamA family protein [Prevotella sp.]|nr:KamA family protein [Prevotella sp.]